MTPIPPLSPDAPAEADGGADVSMGERRSYGDEREPSIFLITLHIIMWTNLTCGVIMVLVVAMLNG